MTYSAVRLISIHAPLAGRDRTLSAISVCERIFQSTRPLRGATCPIRLSGLCQAISIHAPLAGRDSNSASRMRYSILFQSTRPLRGATALVVSMSGRVRISIHAPLAGRDLTTFGLWAITPIFQSTRPLRGATSCALRLQSRTGISIHAPLAGRDDVDHSKLPPVVRFQSTRPLRGATDGETNNSAYGWNFNPRTPCGARPQRVNELKAIYKISIHAPLAGRDSKFDEFLSANLHKSNKRDLLSEEKMRHGLPRTTCMSHFRSFLGAKLQRFSARLPFALRS